MSSSVSRLVSRSPISHLFSASDFSEPRTAVNMFICKACLVANDEALDEPLPIRIDELLFEELLLPVD